MKLGTIAGGLAAAIGLGLLVIAGACLNGPVFYWADPLAADVLQPRFFLAGVAAVLLGAAAMVTAQRGRRGAP